MQQAQQQDIQLVLDEARRIAAKFMGRFTRGSLAMFMFALASETPVIVARVFIAAAINWIVNLANHDIGGSLKWWWVGLLPTFWAASALITPYGTGWWWKQRVGGRSASQRERVAYEDAVALLQSHTPRPLPLPSLWFVLDTEVPDAAVNGDALMLSRGLLESDQLPAVLAHELGHLATPDGRLTAALNRLVIPRMFDLEGKQLQMLLGKHARPNDDRQEHDDHRPPYKDPATMLADADPLAMFFTGGLKLMMFATGGLGLWLTRPFWGHYWRAREYQADMYAARLGQAGELAEFLDQHALIHDHPVPYMWLTDHTHPPTELRIDKLLDHDENHDEPIPARPGSLEHDPPGTDPLAA